MKLIVGLGNPGKEYEATRHNVGFRVADTLAEAHGVTFKSLALFSYALLDQSSEKIALVKPRTFMNQSGEAFAKCLKHFPDSSLDQALAVVDDVNLPLGTVRLRPHGSAGGHHGLESITGAVETSEFPRLRIGVGQAGLAGRDLTDYVLGRFKKSEQALLQQVMEQAQKACMDWALKGVSFAMNRYNRKEKEPDAEG